MLDNIYQHYRDDEIIFVDRVLDWTHTVIDQFIPYLTPFLTPREVMIVEQLTSGYEDVKVEKSGGYSTPERQRVLICPHYYEVQKNDFEIEVIEIRYPHKFAEISHGKILGSILSEGFDRNKIGDIITDEFRWQFFVDKHISEYILMNLHKIGNVGVTCQSISEDEIIHPNIQWLETTVIVSSMRLDTILSKVYNFSRQRSKVLISSGDVKVNFMQIDRPDIEIGEQDIISLRRYGRFRINQIEGITKKENYRLKIDVLER